jgi:hypothetical protein
LHRPRWVRLHLEELETRALLSASAVPAAAPAANPSTVVVQPNSDVAALGNPNPSSSAFSPAQIRQAYGINQATLPNGQAATGAGQTIAIVDAFYDPNIQKDLATFDSAYKLAAPPSFTQVQMNGVTEKNQGWGGETSLDVEWAHAVAPGASILLVETPSASLSDLLKGVSYAASQPGVVAVSMSWGGFEFKGETADDSVFQTPANHPDVTFVASAGDSSSVFGPEYPSASGNVVSVGGTTLHLNSSGGYGSESAWSLGGGGTSAFEKEPSYQKNVQSTGSRTTPDVSYNASPSTGYNIYQTGGGGWLVAGGTSAGAPQWAGIFALADEARGAKLGPLGSGQAALYALPSSDFHDITTGSNGFNAKPGYDEATGLGTPQVNLIVHDLATASNPNGNFFAPTLNGGTGTTAGNAHSHDVLVTGPVFGDPGTGGTVNTSAVAAPLASFAEEVANALRAVGDGRGGTSLAVGTDTLSLPALNSLLTLSGGQAAAPVASSETTSEPEATSLPVINAFNVTYRNVTDFPWAPTPVSIRSSGGEVTADMARQMLLGDGVPQLDIDSGSSVEVPQSGPEGMEAPAVPAAPGGE